MCIVGHTPSFLTMRIQGITNYSAWSQTKYVMYNGITTCHHATKKNFLRFQNLNLNYFLNGKKTKKKSDRWKLNRLRWKLSLEQPDHAAFDRLLKRNLSVEKEFVEVLRIRMSLRVPVLMKQPGAPLLVRFWYRPIWLTFDLPNIKKNHIWN